MVAILCPHRRRGEKFIFRGFKEGILPIFIFFEIVALSGAAGALTPPGAGPEYFPGAKAPPGAGPGSSSGAKAPSGVGPEYFSGKRPRRGQG